ncbi:MAG TPA: polysaccharide deacetylase family protein, partial [Flavobacteriales bacterium]|nr:polysaccharide deacetylase family protein [Flavobacteriales bacterium]
MIRNFLFHRVNPKRDALWDPMDVALFDHCIAYITKHYYVVQLEELLAYPKLHTREKFATIVFDDGYKDNLEYAAPILDKYKCKASFYVVTGCIDNNVPTWTHILEHGFATTHATGINLDFNFLPVPMRAAKFSNAKARHDCVKKLKPLLKKLKHEQRNAVLEKIRTDFADVELPELMMSWHEVGQLKAAGHYIGSHTRSHCMLGTMSDPAEIKDELLGSGKRIEQMLGHFPTTISYPLGSYNDSTIQLSIDCGYKYGLAVK